MQTTKVAGKNNLYYVKNPVQVLLAKPDAEAPRKERDSDIGYDIVLIGRDDERVEDTFGEVGVFTTGLKVTPPPGYYFEVMAVPSLYKSGYMLAPGVMIIEPEFTGEIKVPLYKFLETAEDLELPFRAVRLVLRACEYAHLTGALSLEPTSRAVTASVASKLSLRSTPIDETDIEVPRARRATAAKSTSAKKKATGHFQ